MRFKYAFLAGIMAVLFSATILLAGDKKDKNKPDLPEGLKYQTVCPVTGKEINKDIYLNIQGHRIYFNNPAALDSMKQDPDKYFKKAGEEGVVFENILKTCPFTGKELDKSVFTYYQGKLLYFCDPDAQKLFLEDRHAYLQKLDDFMKSELGKKAEK
jgi:YHS domain-containing protein